MFSPISQSGLARACSTSVQMADKWFIQSYARIFDKTPPSEIHFQWSNPRWMCGALQNYIHLARVRGHYETSSLHAYSSQGRDENLVLVSTGENLSSTNSGCSNLTDRKRQPHDVTNN